MMRNIIFSASIFVCFLSNEFSYANSNFIKEQGYRALQDGDYKAALRHISFLATNGDSKAQYNMGVFYRDGVGVPRDRLTALRWFLKAANSGEMLAEYATGLAFYHGHGCTPDSQTALDYFVKAALQGHANAPLNIGKQFYTGEGVEQNYARAYFWWQLARDRNAGGADDNLRHLKKIMSETDTKEANELIAKCNMITIKQCIEFVFPIAD